MVYRGKPSAGCEPCRKAKKRCGLEQPACLRCMKLRKVCNGYRDTMSLQIEDESAAVRQKALTKQHKNTTSQGQSTSHTPRHTHATSSRAASTGGHLTPLSDDSDFLVGSSDSSDSDVWNDSNVNTRSDHDRYGVGISLIIASMQPKPDDVAANYFHTQFNMSWQEILPAHLWNNHCLSLAIRACGVIALSNVQMVPSGKAYAAQLYGRSLSLLNQALQSPMQSRADEALIAVTMLGYYENLSCEGSQSMDSWKAHIAGATQMLKLRGKQQFRSLVGRILFRETRAQILITCLWDDMTPPDFLEDWQSDLEKHTVESSNGLAMVADSLVKMWLDFARLRTRLFRCEISDQ